MPCTTPCYLCGGRKVLSNGVGYSVLKNMTELNAKPIEAKFDTFPAPAVFMYRRATDITIVGRFYYYRFLEPFAACILPE